MRLASLRDGTRDGELVVVSKGGDQYASAAEAAATLQAALDDWDSAAPYLRELAARLDAGEADALPLDVSQLMAPLPRAYEWLDGSAYLNHVELVRKARGAEVPDFLQHDPLMYQGGSGVLLGARDELTLPEPAWGLDYEAELAVILGDTPQGTTAQGALAAIRLVMLVNDVSYRNLIPAELAKGFGFVQSKPATAFSPFAVTLDELGAAYREGRIYLPLRSFVNDRRMGEPQAGEEMHFSFGDLIAHVCRTRALVAGTIVGSGTVSNRDPERGVSCLAELRMREIIETGTATTPFLTYGDRVRIEMLDSAGRSIFGCIDQRVVLP